MSTATRGRATEGAPPPEAGATTARNGQRDSNTLRAAHTPRHHALPALNCCWTPHPMSVSRYAKPRCPHALATPPLPTETSAANRSA
eukprot:10595479-Lingulodinium_polyedra.AAC.1